MVPAAVTAGGLVMDAESSLQRRSLQRLIAGGRYAAVRAEMLFEESLLIATEGLAKAMLSQRASHVTVSACVLTITASKIQNAVFRSIQRIISSAGRVSNRQGDRLQVRN